MKTDGYVKVDGDELAKLIAPNFEIAKYIKMWEAANLQNKAFDLEVKSKIEEEKNAKIIEKIHEHQFYIKSGQAKLDFEKAKEEGVEIIYDNFKFLWFKFSWMKSNGLTLAKFKQSLQYSNRNFWTDQKCLFWTDHKIDYDLWESRALYKLDKALIGLRPASDLNYEGRFAQRLIECYASKNNQIYNRMCVFTELSGEVFLNISDYNFIQKFIKSEYNDETFSL